ncbi:uncharacterized protein NECHADRAFT_80914 [Fusarium vanettenii 77-13-4]|uniref:Uncharacterized protein n=1 Tax=Fusarium vanettenii (strain ATCC MYA-4622 / CBS 123669 / FGSC 9596 / NRRL 45880 / 77-13-4) TaxID=660122 RepID=C7YT13_FUSV7|nr:uncharacterized protein NECHADRAFT_80914 [Fusarium vanettenii 77-13-4]EEU45742.1 predicted protein [Fusarium vanettenii 77-13-4]
MEVSFEFSAWIINFYYASWLNETSWDEPEADSPKFDDCEPPLLLSPTLVIWLVLVPALASAAQLPGSLLYHGHSTLYRLSPISGLADCFTTYTLVGKALAKGHSWRQSIVGVLLLRQGIGHNDLWWRKFNLYGKTRSEGSVCTSDAGDEDETATLAPTESSDDWLNHDTEELHLRLALARTTEPITPERIAGSILVLFLFVQAVAFVVLVPTVSFLTASAILGLVYTGSLCMFEMLVWSMALSASMHSIAEMPWGNAIELLCTLDPGDGPLSLTQDTTGSQELNSDIELESCHSQDMNDSQYTKPRMQGTPAWGIETKLISGLFGLIEASAWIVITYAAWKVKPRLLFPAAATAILINLGLMINCLFPRIVDVRLGIIRRLDLSDQETNTAVRVGIAALRWLLTKATIANFIAVAWLGLMVAIFILGKAEGWPVDEGKEPTTLPQWLVGLAGS